MIIYSRDIPFVKDVAKPSKPKPSNDAAQGNKSCHKRGTRFGHPYAGKVRHDMGDNRHDNHHPYCMGNTDMPEVSAPKHLFKVDFCILILNFRAGARISRYFSIGKMAVLLWSSANDE